MKLLRPGWSALALLIGVLALLFVASDPPWSFACTSVLHEIPEPASWRTWPAASPALHLYVQWGFRNDASGVHEDRSHFIVGSYANDGGPKICAPGLRTSHIADASLFEHDAPLVLRKDPSSDTLVVVGSEQRFLYAAKLVAASFRERISRTFVFFFKVFLVPICTLLTALTFGHARLWHARRYRDPSRYKEGTRTASGWVEFGDGTPPLPPGHAQANSCDIGAVLVRVESVNERTYRVAQKVVAGEILGGSREAIILRHITIARSPIMALLWIFGLVAFAAALFAAVLWLAFSPPNIH